MAKDVTNVALSRCSNIWGAFVQVREWHKGVQMQHDSGGAVGRNVDGGARGD